MTKIHKYDYGIVHVKFNTINVIISMFSSIAEDHGSFMMMKPDFVLDQHTELYFYSVRSMQKQSASTCKHDMQYGHINLTNSISLFFTYLI
jgi:hypothetical protein